MRKLSLPALLAVALAFPSAAAAGELKLSMDGGLVTLVAKDVPLSMVMAEWAKVGKTTVVNGDKIMTPVTLHLEGVPERKALDIVLRAAAGYMVAERATPVAGGSAFDRVMILPTSQAPATNPMVNRAPQPFAPQRTPQPMPVPVDPDGDEPAQQQGLPPGMTPQGVPGQPNPASPQGPLTSPRPGPLPQPPQGPQQPVPFGAPRPPVGVPGGPGGGGSGGVPGVPGGGGQ